MSVNIPTSYVQQFSTNVGLLVQQKGSRLRKTCSQGAYVGKQASPVDQIGAIAANKVINRFAPMSRVDALFDRRWVNPNDYDLPQMIDSFDKLRIIIDPTSSYSENAMNALGRAQDDEIVAAFHGAALTGQAGTTSTSMLSGNVVSVQQGAAAPTGMTVAKLREAKRLLLTAEVDIDSDVLWAAIKAKQMDNLLAEAQVISMDFNSKPVLMEGRVSQYLGINFVHSERLLSGTDDQSGTSDAVAVYAQSGMHFGEWNAISASVSIRHDIQSEPYQVYVKGTFGATRLEEKKMVKVWCR